MFKKNLKRFVAIMLTAAMVIGSSAMAYADPQFDYAGDVEGWVNKKIFTVLVPTASANALKMLIDPQKLIKDTAAAAKEGLSANDFDDATVLFPRTETGAGIKKFSSTSDSISMANVGTVSVNFTIAVDLTDLGTIVLSDNKTTINNTTDKAVLFVEMLKGTLPGNNSSGVDWADANLKKWQAVGAGGTGATDAIVVSQNKSVTLSADVVPTVKNLYKVSWNSTEEYTYGIPKTSVSTAKINAYAATDGLFKTQFSGTTNNGDLVAWRDAKASQPKLTLTYSFETVEDGVDVDEKDLPADTVDAYANVQDFGGSTGYVLLTKPSESSTFEGLTSASQITDYKLKYNNGSYVDVIDKVMVYNGMVGITYVNAKAALGFDSLSAGDKITIQVVYDDTTYEAVYTQQ